MAQHMAVVDTDPQGVCTDCGTPTFCKSAHGRDHDHSAQAKACTAATELADMASAEMEMTMRYGGVSIIKDGNVWYRITGYAAPRQTSYWIRPVMHGTTPYYTIVGDDEFQYHTPDHSGLCPYCSKNVQNYNAHTLMCGF